MPAAAICSLGTRSLATAEMCHSCLLHVHGLALQMMLKWQISGQIVLATSQGSDEPSLATLSYISYRNGQLKQELAKLKFKNKRQWEEVQGWFFFPLSCCYEKKECSSIGPSGLNISLINGVQQTAPDVWYAIAGNCAPDMRTDAVVPWEKLLD